MSTDVACPGCGFLIVLVTEPPRFGALRCDECGAAIDPDAPPRTTISLGNNADIEAGAEQVRRLAEQMKSGDR